MASLFSMTSEAFIETYMDFHPNRSGLVLKNKENGECIFLEGVNHCRVQHAKPYQCKGFPNSWNFSGWQKVCEAIPVPVKPEHEKGI